MSVAQNKPSAVGRKFDEHGRVLSFPGNTIICHVKQKSPLMATLLRAHEALQDLDIDKKIVRLPPSSYHMTVFEGVCDQVRSVERWPWDLPTSIALDEVSKHFARSLGGFRHESELPFRLRAMPPLQKWGACVLALEPLDEAEERKLRTLRDRLASALHLRTPDHDSYVFHITLAYVIDWPSAADEAALAAIYADLQHRVNALGPITLGAPEFCAFDDMFAFKRQFYLAG